MPTLLTYRGVVYPWHCDHMGHMNVMWYAGKFDEGTWQLAAALGLGAGALRALGAGLVAAEQHTHYRAELHAGDAICVESGLLGLGNSTLRFRHAMWREPDRTEAATSTLVGVFIDLATRRPRALPPGVRAAAQALLPAAVG